MQKILTHKAKIAILLTEAKLRKFIIHRDVYFLCYITVFCREQNDE